VSSQLHDHPSITSRRDQSHYTPAFPGNLAENSKIPGDFPPTKPLSHRYKGGGVQEPEFPYAMSQLPAVWPRMGKLQAATPLFVVWGRTPAQGVPREREGIFYTRMLQLPVGRR
jgi:hypothetical protein